MLNDPSYTEEQAKEVKDRLSDLKEKRRARLELVSRNRKDLQSNIARIKQTVERVLDSDTSLAEKIRTIIREQGIVLGGIAAFVTVLGFIIDKIVKVFTGGSSGSGGKTPPNDEQGVKKWIKDKLKALARLFAKLSEKAAAALPGIIGSVVSWLLNTLGKVVGFAAENIWAFIAFVVGIVFTYITKKSHLKK